MRVFGKRGGAQQRSNEGRGWSQYSNNDVIVNLPSSADSPRSFDFSAPAPATDPQGQMPVVSNGAMALIEQLARELNGNRALAPVAVTAPVPAPAYGASELLALVSELRGEIKSLKQERVQEPPRPAIRAEDREVYGLLAELRKDIGALKVEQKRVFKREEDREVQNLLAELRGDIRALKEEQAKVERRDEDREVHNMLAALKSDIVALKKEQQAHDVKRYEDREVRDLLSSLKGDIEALKQEQQSYAAKPPVNDVQNLLASLKGDIDRIKIANSQTGPRAEEIGGAVAPEPVTAPLPTPSVSAERESAKRIARASEKEFFLLADSAFSEGDLAGARRLYNAAVNEGSLLAIIELARSFDPAECNQFGAGEDVEADRDRARSLYRQAAKQIAALIEELA